MEKYILELVKENNRVIIPNFGAFIISKEKGDSILFNNFLSFNDGLLVNYIAEKKGVDTIVATDEVFEYVDNLKRDLDETGHYIISGLGEFKKDENGILRFQQAEISKDVNEGLGDQEVEYESSEEKTDSDLLDIDKDSQISQASEDESENDESDLEDIVGKGDTSILTIDDDEEESDENVEKKEIVSSTQPDSSKGEIKEKPRNETSRESEIKKEPEVNRYVQKTIEDRKRKDMITFLFIVFIVIVSFAGYFIFFNTSPAKKNIPVAEEVPPEPKIPVKKDSVVKVQPKPEVIEKPEPKEVSIDKSRIHIIVGGFKEESNANKMVEKLRKSGYGKAIVIPKGVMYLVSIDSDKSYRKMEARQQEILENERIESWMYTIK